MRTQQNQNQRLPLYDVHPISIKQIQRGHPWILGDQFTEKFNPKDKFIVATNFKKPFALLIHDPAHKFIKARVWSTQGNFGTQIQSFRKDLSDRIKQSVAKRQKMGIRARRDNFYLIFGEADGIPGLMVQMLGERVLIQFYTSFWKGYQEIIVKELQAAITSSFNFAITVAEMWTQTRGIAHALHEPAQCLNPNQASEYFEISENGINFELQLGLNYDMGIYTDMASIREKEIALFENKKSVLNLYAYTGAFSLLALKKGAQKVVSVDLSEKYLKWLETNLKLNKDLDKSLHTSMPMATMDALHKLKGESFDLIITDPPSSSSDGQKRTSALKDYEISLPLMLNLLAPNGQLVVFLNTHKVGRKKFEEKIQEILVQHKIKDITVEKKIELGDDCPAQKGFPEGSYLKGIVLKKASVAHD